MDTGAFTKIAIGAVLVLLIIVSVAVPLLDGIQYTEQKSNTPTGFADQSIPSGEFKSISNGFSIDNVDQGINIGIRDWIIISDTFMLIRTSSSLLYYIDYAEQRGDTVSSIIIDGTAATYRAGSVEGSLGANAIVRTASGSIGVYTGQSFIVDRGTDIITSKITVDSIDGIGAVRGVIRGTADDLEVSGLALLANNQLTFIDASTATATMTAGSYEEISNKTIEVASNPQISISFTYNGQQHSTTAGLSTSLASSIMYTDTNAPMPSMIGIVPLLMIVGVIGALISTLIIRRS